MNDIIKDSILDKDSKKVIKSKKLASPKYTERRGNILNGFKALMEDVDLVTKSDGSYSSYFYNALSLLSEPLKQGQMLLDLSYLKKAIESDTNFSIFDLLKTKEGILALLKSETFASLLQDEEIWKILDSDKITTIAHRYKDTFKNWGIPDESIDTLVPNLLKIVKQLSQSVASNNDDIAEFITLYIDYTSTSSDKNNVENFKKFLGNTKKLLDQLNLNDLLYQEGKLSEPVKSILLVAIPVIKENIQERIKSILPKLSQNSQDSVEKIINNLPQYIEKLSEKEFKALILFVEKNADIVAGSTSILDADAQFYKDLLSMLNSFESLTSDKDLKDAFNNFTADVLPLIHPYLSENARIFIPNASTKEILENAGDYIPKLISGIVQSGILPLVLSKDANDKEEGIKAIIIQALSFDLEDILKNEDVLDKYIKDLKDQAFKANRHDPKSTASYVFSYLADEERVNVSKRIFKNLAPKLLTNPKLIPAILTLYDFANTPNADKKLMQETIGAGLELAKSIDNFSDYELVVKMELERQLSIYKLDHIVDKKLQEAAVPLLTKLIANGLKNPEVKSLPKYLIDVMYGRISTFDATFDAIDFFASEARKDPTIKKEFFAFTSKPANQQILATFCDEMFEKNILLKGQGKKIAHLLADEKSFEPLLEIYDAYRKGNYGKAGLKVIYQSMPLWKKNDLRSIVVKAVLNFIHGLIYDYIYPNFVRRKVFGKLADEIFEVATHKFSDENTALNDIDARIASNNEEIEKLMNSIRSQETPNLKDKREFERLQDLGKHLNEIKNGSNAIRKINFRDVMNALDSKGKFSNEHLLYTGSFKGLEIKKDFNGFIFENLNFSKSTFNIQDIKNCEFKNSKLENVVFVKEIKIENNIFDLDSLLSLTRTLSIRKNKSEFKSNTIQIEKEVSIRIDRDSLHVDKLTMLSINEFRKLHDIITLKAFNGIKINGIENLGVSIDPNAPLSKDDKKLLDSAKKMGITKGLEHYPEANGSGKKLSK